MVHVFPTSACTHPSLKKKTRDVNEAEGKGLKIIPFFFFVGAFGVDIIKIGYWLPSIKGRYLASKKDLKLRYRQAGRGSNRCLYCICMDFFLCLEIAIRGTKTSAEVGIKVKLGRSSRHTHTHKAT